MSALAHEDALAGVADAHCHVPGGAAACFLCDPCDEAGAPGVLLRFRGVHPWDAERYDEAALRRALEEDAHCGVGETGLDRLKTREISAAQRAAFASQLALAAEYSRPVALHGAKCWGEVVKAAKPWKDRIPGFIFHGFSRSTGLVGEIAAMGGFIAIGPALLNDHAINYRAMAAALPPDMLLVETDRTRETAATAPAIREIVGKLAQLRKTAAGALAETLIANQRRFSAFA